jgi:hypothetical protein
MRVVDGPIGANIAERDRPIRLEVAPIDERVDLACRLSIRNHALMDLTSFNLESVAPTPGSQSASEAHGPGHHDKR